MSRFKDYKEFQEKFKRYSISEHVLLHCLGIMSKSGKDISELNNTGFDLKLLINGEEFDFSPVMELIDKHFEKLEKDINNIKQENIERLFKEKVTDKLYTILDSLESVDNVVRSCISWENE